MGPAHPEPPMTVRRSGVARPRRATAHPSPSRLAPLGRTQRAWGPPMQEPAGSTTARWASAMQAPVGREPAALPQPALPKTARAHRCRGREAEELTARGRPTLARPLRAVTRAMVHPSPGRGPLARRVIPRSEGALGRRREQAAERGSRANPTWAPDRQAGRRVPPTRVMWLLASPERPPVGPSSATRSAVRRWSAQQGSPVAPRQAEPMSRRPRRSGWSAMLVEPGAPPSCACVACASLDRGRRRAGPPPPG